eukprot:TRINITY_DN2840_c1_g2_i1.p1 TRINITY_DN2840_c1_g2~~TRINITY_DN2840_c1_g2_i1.p1  ORF type:complete len:304 (+),score=98.67 TRINITY_DN2840_c1_g2_i1:49-960(+)
MAYRQPYPGAYGQPQHYGHPGQQQGRNIRRAPSGNAVPQYSRGPSRGPSLGAPQQRAPVRSVSPHRGPRLSGGYAAPQVRGGQPGYAYAQPQGYPHQGYPQQHFHPGHPQQGFHQSGSRYHSRPAARGPRLPFLQELSSTVPQENAGVRLPFLDELSQKSGNFIHTLPSSPLPFVTELRKVKPEVNPEEGIVRAGVTNKLSQAVTSNGLVFLSGQVAGDTSADVKGQAEQIFEKIDWRLKEAGTDKSKLVSADIWLTSIKDAKEFNAAWEEWIPEGAAPARACVEAKLVNPAFKVEVRVVAAV